MARSVTLPDDYAIDAISTEAWNRRTSYGRLVAELTPQERQKIIDDYRRKFFRDKAKERERLKMSDTQEVDDEQ